MSWNKEYSGAVKKTSGLGSRSGISSKSSFPPSSFSSVYGISSNLNKVSLKDDNLDTSGFNLSAKKKKKPRRSMLGRRTKICSQNNDGDFSNSMRPLYSSSPKDELEKQLVTPQINKYKSSPSHPFSNLNTSSFFETEQSSNFSTWSVFKKGDRLPKPPEKSSKDLAQNASLDVPKPTKKVFDPDNSLGTIPLDSLYPEIETEKVYTAYKQKKLSVVKEETETLPVIIINKSEVELEKLVEEEELEEIESKNLSELIQNWFIAKENWDKSRKQLEKDAQKMNELNLKISQILKQHNFKTTQTDKLSNTLVPDKIQINKENENPTQYSVSKNDLVDTIYGEFKSTYPLLQSPSVLSTIKQTPINSLCYTPNSLSSRVKSQIKLIYGNDG